MRTSRQDFDRLFASAGAARENACASYSKFKVGAAVLTNDGRIYTGCNVESSSYGLTMCAERNALAGALCAGERDFKAILITADTPGPVSPCGACRQLIFDYAPDIEVIMTNIKGSSAAEDISVLLKYPFGLSKLK
ncbi:MAG TPA: cytidine deaminase [Clostridiales bacterium]|nr:cytidine deaminase [Clostridiales bacterium]